MGFLLAVMLALLVRGSMPAGASDTDGNEGVTTTRGVRQGTDQGTEQGTNKTTESLTKLEGVVNGNISAALDHVNKNVGTEVKSNPNSTFPTPQDVALTKQALNILWTAVTAMEAKVNQSANQKS